MAEQDNNFSWKRDFKNVNWPATLKYSLIRAFFAGVAWFLLGLMIGAGNQSGQSLHGAGMVIGFPICYFIFLLPIGLVTGWLSGMGVPFAGFISLVFSLMIVIGDPFVFILKKLQPNSVPVDKPGFFNFKLIIFVINEPAVATPDSGGNELSGSLFKKK